MSMRIGDAHRPLRTIVCDEIRRRILEHQYEPGSRLIEEHLAEQLGVSRNPVREALRVLEAEGFVEIVPRRGAVVASQSLADAEDLYEVLLTLEGLAVRLAARKSEANPVAVDRLREVVEATEAAALEADSTRVAELNSEFHRVVLELADNPQLENVLTLLRGRNLAYTHIGPPAIARLAFVFEQGDGARGRTNATEHRAMAEAIGHGDEAAAAVLVEQHIQASRVAYAQLIAGDREGVVTGVATGVATGDPTST